MAARVEQVVTSGTFSLDGETHQVDNNTWIVGDDRECVVIDAGHDVAAVVDAVAGRTVVALLLTHGHDDHVRLAPALADELNTTMLLCGRDAPVWELTHPGLRPDGALEDGQELAVAGTVLTVAETPGHSPGSVCLYARELGCVFTGDTLFEGGPGATGRSFSDADLIRRSISERLFVLPDDTVVHTGHGPDTTIAAERAAF